MNDVADRVDWNDVPSGRGSDKSLTRTIFENQCPLFNDASLLFGLQIQMSQVGGSFADYSYKVSKFELSISKSVERCSVCNK